MGTTLSTGVLPIPGWHRIHEIEQNQCDPNCIRGWVAPAKRDGHSSPLVGRQRQMVGQDSHDPVRRTGTLLGEMSHPTTADSVNVDIEPPQKRVRSTRDVLNLPASVQSSTMTRRTHSTLSTCVGTMDALCVSSHFGSWRLDPGSIPWWSATRVLWEETLKPSRPVPIGAAGFADRRVFDGAVRNRRQSAPLRRTETIPNDRTPPEIDAGTRPKPRSTTDPCEIP